MVVIVVVYRVIISRIKIFQHETKYTIKPHVQNLSRNGQEKENIRVDLGSFRMVKMNFYISLRLMKSIRGLDGGIRSMVIGRSSGKFTGQP